MERDTPNRFDQFDQSNYQPTNIENYGQPQPDKYSQQQNGQFNLNQTLPINQSQNYVSGPNNQQWSRQMTNQMNNPNQFPGTLPNQASQGPRQQVRMNPRDAKILNDCSKQGFFFLTLPSTVGFLLYKQYNSLKTLKPVGFTSLGFNALFVYVSTKLIWAPICYNRLKKANPEFLNEIKNQNFRNNNYSTIPVNQPQSGQLPYQQPMYQPPSAQQKNIKLLNSPYLSEEFKQQNKEFVDDNYDASGYDRKF